MICGVTRAGMRVGIIWMEMVMRTGHVQALENVVVFALEFHHDYIFASRI